ncbi:TlpA disulfide reductase family protein [Bdellovibrio reynosensis]|uniref:TlpA family protein disulfide reductase n=1 Tax=Bdellovibrio reynosensis TaxID=2835041 RepID=A0ABY4CCH9_9BACT|nr:TlpA disulfide reductase family protein [Bdellovibrio reynosensis]UOF02676.1 TlpA family protein disulfide reductase [Bdellovibrio reynosensis]
MINESKSVLTVGDIEVSKWLNAAEGFELPSNKVVAIHAFQMLCPGCVMHGIPQAQKLHASFSEEHVAVIGLHTVFEHHDAMTEVALKAFLYEFRVGFPVGIDVPLGDGIPKTMQRFQMQGTPSWLIFDRKGNLQIHVFGQLEDITLGAEVARLALEGMPSDIPLHKKLR